MTEINIDATNAIVGRVATYAAKQALLGNSVNILHCEKAIISGDPVVVRKKYLYRINEIGMPAKGPHLSRLPDRFVRRIVRGMLDYKQGRGKAAFERIMCYIDVPSNLNDKKLVKVAKDVDGLPKLKYQTIGELCSWLGGKA